jgi:nitrite reductase/ring-hydroxylating ferredoxin subunit
MEARGFVGRVDGKQRNIFAVRRNGEIYIYLNQCPHVGSLIDHIQGQFFAPDGVHLRCGMHGAIFRIEDGVCVTGPCEGESLRRLATEIRDGGVFLVE